MADLSDEDRKLVTLARAARARGGARSGAALRDGTGRMYVGVDVELPSLRLSALALCVAQAVVGGSTSVEAAVLVMADAVPGPDPAERDGAVPDPNERDPKAPDPNERDPAVPDPTVPDLGALADLGGAGVPVLIADGRGEVVGTVVT